MIVILIQLGFLFALVITQVAFLNVAFPMSAPNALVCATVSWVILRGFASGWRKIVMLGLIFDALTGGVMGVSSLSFLAIGYGVEIISRRMLADHKAISFGVALVAAWVSTVFFEAFTCGLRSVFTGMISMKNECFQLLGIEHFVSSVLISSLVFVGMYFLIRRMNKTLDFYDDRVIIRR